MKWPDESFRRGFYLGLNTGVILMLIVIIFSSWTVGR